MPDRPIAVAAALTAALVIAVLARRQHQLRRVLHTERAARRITEASLVRDIDAFDLRLRRVMADQASTADVLAQADAALDAALATHHRPDTPPTEGGPTA
ncbi:hypothetical protein H1V43_33765 [Streptomyces sp. PSKA54]|uniref:Uncharacterized protein n=1 Tax=Streptomyces himalayensis subsp. aureolus TaxID=2758039 RepID=A0A7W2HJK7_9ACTN|nr:hypothetical protein [Streptomyces himalayensis]MBA4866203.1 hypothetical protein [Streptomyces himalayensis subsp. aureolus]